MAVRTLLAAFATLAIGCIGAPAELPSADSAVPDAGPDVSTLADDGAKKPDDGGGPTDSASPDVDAIPDAGTADAGSDADSQSFDATADSQPDSSGDADADADMGGPVSNVRYFGYHERWSATPATGENTTVVGWVGQGNISRYRFIYVADEVLEQDINGRNIRPFRLRADWQQALQDFKTSVEFEVQNGYVTGFNMGYSLLWHGLPMADFTAYADELRRLFPDSDLWWMEDADVFERSVDENGVAITLNVPASVDLLGVYSWYGPWEANNDFEPNFVAQEKLRFQGYVFPRLGPDQRVILIPTAGAWNEYLAVCDLDCHDTAMEALATAYYEWARDEDKIVGVSPYAWTFYNSGTGVQGLPKTRAAYERIGQDIEANHP